MYKRVYSYTLLRVPLGDFDFSYVATSCGVPGTVFCLVYALFLLIALNAFVVVMFDCFVYSRRQEARKLNPFYLQDLVNQASRR